MILVAENSPEKKQTLVEKPAFHTISSFERDILVWHIWSSSQGVQDFSPPARDAEARDAARRSMVLLKNDGDVLPLKKSGQVGRGSVPSCRWVVGKWLDMVR